MEVTVAFSSSPSLTATNGASGDETMKPRADVAGAKIANPRWNTELDTKTTHKHTNTMSIALHKANLKFK